MDDVLVASPADASRADASLPTRWGDFRISVFRFDGSEVVALARGGLDAVDANIELGLPVDARDYSAAAAALRELGVRSVRLITNNPAKILGLEMHGVDVVERVPIETIPNAFNAPYLRTKASKMGHLLDNLPDPRQVDAATIPAHRPLVTVHYAQTLDGRIASRTGDSQWVSGEGSLRLAHELRAAHDAVLVGIGTVLADDPKLTVRLVPGHCPGRVVVDSQLRISPDANVLDTSAARTIVATTPVAFEERAGAIRVRGAEVLRVR